MLNKLLFALVVVGAVNADAATIRGVVVHAGKPVAGATITPRPTGMQAVTDARGAFAITPGGDWPRVLEIAHRGLGTRRIDAPVAHADASLGTIELARGATVRVRVKRGADKGPIDVRIAPRVEEHVLPQWLAVRRVQKDDVATFGDLAPGSYMLLVEGDEPLERVTSLAVVAAGDVRTVDVQPVAGLAVARFTAGGKPLANAEITLSKGWSTKLKTDDAGEFRGVIWERGEYQVSVKAGAIDATFAGYVDIPKETFPRFAFDVPDRRVRGRVVDAKGNALAGARVSLRTIGSRYTSVRRAVADARGVFVYDGVPAGVQTIQASVAGHLRPDPLRFELGENEKSKDVDVVVASEYPRSIVVVDHHGEPHAGATVISASNLNVRSSVTTDAQGRAMLGTPLEGDSTLYVIPRSGGFVVRRLRAPMDGGDERVRVLVPPATASLNVETLSTDGDPLREVSLLMRVNGEVVPPEVARELAMHQGIELVTDDRGVARLPRIAPGSYEFWPYRGDAEAEAVMAASSSMAAPVSVNVRTGDNSATVRFKRRR